MGRKQEIARPYFEVLHEFTASQKAYQEAAMMLLSAIRSGSTIVKGNPDAATKVLAMIEEHANAFEKVAHGGEHLG